MDRARREIADVVDALVQHVPVRVAAGADEAAAIARRALPSAAEIVMIPTGDIWLRDTGPVVMETGTGALIANQFAFNGWGGKFDMPGDTETAAALAAAESLPTRAYPFVLEGGAIEGDGAGRVLTTRQCLLHRNRNQWTKARAETALDESLGARSVYWIDEGLDGDHTDGHIDNIARFVGSGHVVCQAPYGPDDPHAARLREIEDAIRATDLTITLVPSPGRIEDPAGQPLPASHLNFVISNGLVLVPVFAAGADAGAEAVGQLAALFPERTVLGLPADAILAGGGGAFHCITCHIPTASGRRAP